MSEPVVVSPTHDGREPHHHRWGVLPQPVLPVLVSLLLALVVLLLVPRPDSRPAATLDLPAAAAAAAADLDFAPAVPVGLPGGWVPISARVLDATDGVRTWRVGLLTPAGHPVAYLQGDHPTRAWESRLVTDGREQGVRSVSGSTWVVRSRTDRGITSLVLRRPGLTWIVTGRADDAELGTLIGSLPLDAAAGS